MTGNALLWFAVLFGGTSIGQAIASEESEKWFNHGTAPLSVVTRTPDELLSGECKSCHEEIFRDWKSSRHAVAQSNPLFQEGYWLEPQQRCLYCHAPLMFQQASSGRRLLRRDLAHEGVNCATCHIRSGTIFSSSSAGYAYHPYERDQRLRSPEFCAGCHQFGFGNQLDGGVHISSLAVQNTYEEWRSYQASGGNKTCQQCHMPNGRHTFRGGHDLETLRGAFKLSATAIDGMVRFRLDLQNVGHEFPTGDLFRSLSLEIKERGERTFREAARFEKTYSPVIDSKTGDAYLKKKSDTTLRPFESRIIALPGARPIEYRLVYRYTSAKNMRMSQLPKRELELEVLRGEVE